MPVLMMYRELYLFTIFLDCGLVAHRTCAATGLPSCLPTVDRPLGIQFKSVFGQGLCIQFNPTENPAPPIVSDYRYAAGKSLTINYALQRLNVN